MLIDSDGRILLQEVEPDSGAGTFWITPGGGLEPGESFEDAAVREVREEVGHARASLGPWIWSRRHEFVFRGARIRQTERLFVARCEPFEVDESGLDDLELEVVKSHRWWTLAEMRSSSAVFAPSGLPDLVEPLLRGELPAQPIAVGV